MKKSFNTYAWTIKKATSTALIGLALLGLPAEVSAQAQKNTQKSSQKSNQAKPTQKKAEPKKTTAKKTEPKKTTTKKSEPKKTTKKPTTQPSRDGKGVIPVSSHDEDGKSLLEQQAPSEEELSVANKELLAKNAELERQVNVLTNQNNVLTQEKSGQLFMYGTMTSIFSVILGGLVVKLFGNRKERW